MKRPLLILAAIATASSALFASVPAVAQFLPFWGQRQPYYQPQYQERYREPAPADYSKAPSAKKPETTPTTTVAVMGDAMADWLAYGLEDAFSDNPEIGIIRKNKANSGLIRYESRSELEWSSVARDIINTDKPAIAIMMLGLSDRGPIRERPAAAKPPAQPGQQPPPQAQPAPAGQPPQQAQPQEQADAEAPAPIIAPETPRGRGSSNEFRSEVWAELYSKKIAETIQAMKSRGVPVLWVGLPSIRGQKSSSDAIFLNDLYRAQAEKAGIIYVDVWDGFVDENGRYVNSGPDVDGQTRRLRAQDGVYFTKYGARKLAHYVEREIRRVLAARALPVSLPVDAPSAVPKPSGPVARPVAGAVLPLTAGPVTGGDALVGGGAPRVPASDPIAQRVLVKGEPITPLKGRADDFVWQGNGQSLPTANINQEPGTITPVEIPVAAPATETEQKPKEAQPTQPRRPRPSQAARDAQRQQEQQQRFRSPFFFFR